jgi:hypothetical protein
MEKQKKLVDTEIFSKSSQTPFRWKDLSGIQFEPDDVILVQWNEPYYSENNSWDGHYSASVVRQQLETDEQFEKRIKREADQAAAMKARRLETYQKLKAEFEPQTPTDEN